VADSTESKPTAQSARTPRETDVSNFQGRDSASQADKGMAQSPCPTQQWVHFPKGAASISQSIAPCRNRVSRIATSGCAEWRSAEGAKCSGGQSPVVARTLWGSPEGSGGLGFGDEGSSRGSDRRCCEIDAIIASCGVHCMRGCLIL
jgi:hypothetical protein